VAARGASTVCCADGTTTEHTVRPIWRQRRQRAARIRGGGLGSAGCL